MPRTNINKITALGPYPTLQPAANALDFAVVAADVGNKNSTAFGSNSRMLLMWINTDGAVARTVTISSVVDTFNRTGDITNYSAPAVNVIGGMIVDRGWMQSDGNLYYEANNAAVKFAVIPLG